MGFSLLIAVSQAVHFPIGGRILERRAMAEEGDAGVLIFPQFRVHFTVNQFDPSGESSCSGSKSWYPSISPAIPLSTGERS